MVEPPGTAPGSEPLITRGFIAIVPKNDTNIGVNRLRGKNLGQIEALIGLNRSLSNDR